MNDKFYYNPSLRKLQKEYEQQEKQYHALKNEWNQLIRNFYAKNMGVSLRESGTNAAIQIKIEAAPNQGFIDIIEKNYPHLDFEELYALTQFVAQAKQVIPYFEDKHAKHHLQMSIEYAQYRLKEFDILSLTESIFPFLQPKNKDVFGCYFIQENRIEIYVFPIKLFCILHGLDDRTFFVIVLAHELAHGYNHIGMDKDKHFWKAFAQTDDYIAEGLAQYYTAQFIDNYLHKNSRLREVFDKLGTFQPAPYNVFNQWNLSLEQIYSAFIEARRNDVCVYEDFEKLMAEAKKRVKGGRVLFD